jgi:hypothetical protein
MKVASSMSRKGNRKRRQEAQVRLLMVEAVGFELREHGIGGSEPLDRQRREVEGDGVAAWNAGIYVQVVHDRRSLLMERLDTRTPIA